MTKLEVIDYKRRYLEMNVMQFLIRKQLKDINNWFIADIKSRGMIPNLYNCQKCHSMIVLEELVDIVIGISPRCMGCLGNVTVTKKMVDDYIKEHYKEEEC